LVFEKKRNSGCFGDTMLIGIFTPKGRGGGYENGENYIMRSFVICTLREVQVNSTVECSDHNSDHDTRSELSVLQGD